MNWHSHRKLVLILLTVVGTGSYLLAYKAHAQSDLLPALSGSSSGRTNLKKGATTTALDRYLERKDPTYSWKKIDEGKVGSAEYAGLILTSQNWRGITWKHQLYIVKPKSCAQKCQQGLLLIGGGSWKDELEQKAKELPREAKRMAQVAEQLKCPIAILLQVPNQPLFEGKYEDQIIAYTFEKFVRSGEDDWPLLLPMVKAAHRGMDATAEWVKQKWGMQLKNFTVTGASKRGWTTWLTGATDSRVNAIAPMVIDVLNMKPQMEHQKKAWGEYSNQIRDYTERGLQDLLSTEKGKRLREIVDPYSYRDRLTQPKLIFIGTNDAYWPVDALQFYWNDLVKEKYVCYVPNNGHGLNDYARMIGSLHGLQMQASGAQDMPNMKWKFREISDQRVELTIQCSENPDKIQIWSAESATRDFRKSKWKAQTLKKDKSDRYSISFQTPDEGAIAFLGEGIFNRDNFPCYLSTNVKVLQKTDHQKSKIK